MQNTLRPTDFVKVTRFISKETKKYNGTAPIVKEISSVDLYVGKCRITKSGEVWIVVNGEKEFEFNSKRNAMYYAFLVAFQNTKLIPELIQIDAKLGNSQNDIVRLKHILSQPAVKKDGWKLGLYHNKLSEAVARYKKAKNDMHNWMDYAKYIN